MVLGKTIADRKVWRAWFAWRPISEHRNGRLVWLERVWTKEVAGNFFPYRIYKLRTDRDYDFFGAEES